MKTKPPSPTCLKNTAKKEFCQEKIAKKEKKAKTLRCKQPHHKAGRCKICDKKYVKKVGCHKRTCPECQKDRADILLARTAVILANLEKRRPAGYAARLLTLTIRGSKDKRRDVELLHKAWQQLWRNLLKEITFCAVRSTEFGKKTLNAHIHIYLYSRHISVKEIREKWLKYTHGRGQQVDLQLINPNRGKGGLVEVIKYVGNIEHFSTQDKAIIEDALRKRRRVALMGIFQPAGYRAMQASGYTLDPLPSWTPSPWRCDCGGIVEMYMLVGDGWYKIKTSEGWQTKAITLKNPIDTS